MSLKTDENKLKVIRLNKTMGPVAIGKELGIAHQTVSDFLNEETWKEWWHRYRRGEILDQSGLEDVEPYIQGGGGALELSKGHTLPREAGMQFELVGTVGEPVRLATNNFQYNSNDHCWHLGNRILVISDTHFPYHHPDVFDFLEHLADKHNITGVVSVGDMNDNHYPSYHEKEYDCYSGKEELERSQEACQTLESLFPNMLISEGNHDILPKRKAQSADIPLDWVAHPNTIYGLKGGWQWNSHHYFYTGDSKCLLVHSVGTNTRTNAERYSHNSVQGHHHSEFAVAYSSDTDRLKWSMSTGCLINPKAPAFRYDKKIITKRPILGAGVVVDNTPYTEPMVLKTDGRWRGY